LQDSGTLTQTSITFAANVEYGEWFQIIITVKLLDPNQYCEIFKAAAGTGDECYMQDY
jgi:hypothetical protein